MHVRALLSAALTLACLSGQAAVDANTADQAALQTLSGVGPALATRILEARRQDGPFRDLDDLRERVRGVGAIKLQKMVASGLVAGPAGGPLGNSPLPGASRVPGIACMAPAVEVIVGQPSPRQIRRK